PALYRSLSALLLARGDLSDPLRARLEQEVDDDPLQLADARLRDARTMRFGRIFNALSEAAGRSFSNTMMLGYRLASALLYLAVAERTDDALTLPERQALAHWKQFVEQHPGAPEAPAVVERIEEAQQRWYRTQRDHSVDAAEQALEKGDARLGLALSERAVRYAAEDADARGLLARAERETHDERVRLSRSEGAELRDGAGSPAARALAQALLISRAGESARIEAAAAPLA